MKLVRYVLTNMKLQLKKMAAGEKNNAALAIFGGEYQKQFVEPIRHAEKETGHSITESIQDVLRI